MQLISRLEQATRLDPAVSAGQRAGRLIRPGKIRDGLHGVWRIRGARAGHRAQPAFRAREVGGAIQVCLPGAG